MVSMLAITRAVSRTTSRKHASLSRSGSTKSYQRDTSLSRSRRQREVEHEVGGGDKTAFLGVQAKNYALAKMLKIHNVSKPILVTWIIN